MFGRKKKTLVVAIMAASAGVSLSPRYYDPDQGKTVLDYPYQGKRGKKGKALKDWDK